jgi:hypothetical protein
MSYEDAPRFNPFRFVVIAVAGSMNQKQQHAIDYLREENRVLREQLGARRPGSQMINAAVWQR